MGDDDDRTVFRPLGVPGGSERPQPTGWGTPAPSQGWGAPVEPARPQWEAPAAPVGLSEPAPAETRHEYSAAASAASRPAKLRPAHLLLGGGVVLAVVAAGAILFWPDPEVIGPGPEFAGTGPAEAPSTASPEANASPEQAVASALPAIGCSWLNLAVAQVEAAGLSVAVQGAAGHPVKAQNQVEAAAEQAGARVAQLDFSAVAQVNPSLCGPIQAFSAIRNPGAQRLSMPAQSIWEIAPQQLESEEGWNYAQPLLEVNIGNPSQDFAVFGMEGASGLLQPIIYSRAHLDSLDDAAITRLPNDRFRLNLATGHTGWSGILLVTGNAPFDQELFVPAGGGDAAWARSFAGRAAERGWKTEMHWYKVVDELPNEGAGPAPA